MKVEIRKLSRDDKPAVMELLRATSEFMPQEVLVAGEVIDCHLEDPVRSGYDVYVATVSGVLQGYVCYGLTPLTESTWDIYWIAVSSELQGHGIGRRLMSWAECRIEEGGGRMVLVETSSKPDYEKTRRFYRSLNYDAICEIADFYAPGDGKVVFQKKFNVCDDALRPNRCVDVE
ncbi:MAG: GNAT family N-acetyltransferase [Dehalococcoidia bacterium]|nr:GNAT family N-acetyltransferase [Dehalococcoidia bacterium]